MIAEFFRHLWIVLWPFKAIGSSINPFYLIAVLLVFLLVSLVGKAASSLRTGCSFRSSYTPKPKPKSYTPFSANTSTSVSGVSTWNSAFTKPDLDPISANVNSRGEFRKIMYHGTPTLEAASEILKRNLWVVGNCAVQGLNFGDIVQAAVYGKYIVQVEVRCKAGEVSEYDFLNKSNNSNAKIIRYSQSESGFQYYIPHPPTADGERVRPSIVKPLKILMKGDD